MKVYVVHDGFNDEMVKAFLDKVEAHKFADDYATFNGLPMDDMSVHGVKVEMPDGDTITLSTQTS